MFKKVAIAALATTAIAAPASAAHTFAGNIGFTVGDCTDVCTGSFTGPATSPTFAHYYTFSLPNMSQAVASQISEITVRGSVNFDENIYITAYDTVTGTAVGQQYDFTVTNGPGVSRAVLTTVGALAGGDYRLYLSGTSTNSGNAYSGTVTLAAVPEPATWALFILGFGAVGAGMRRRSSQVRSTKASIRFA